MLPHYTNVVMPWTGKEPPYVPDTIRQASAEQPSPFRATGDLAMSSTSAEEASPLCGAMENSSEWEKILDFRPNSTSPSWSPKATTSSQSWSSEE